VKNIGFAMLIVFFTVAAGIYYIVQPSLHHEMAPSVIRVGVLPDDGELSLHQRYDPLLQYLSAKTGLDYKLVVPSSYVQLVQLFHDHKLELAYFGGLTFLRAHQLDNAEALVMRDVDTRFTSWFLVRESDPGKDLADFEGRRLAFGNWLSTSGHLMPRYFLSTEQLIMTDTFFSEILYSGAHDKTAYLVRDGVVDVGVANSKIILSMIRDGRLKKNDLRVLWETPPYPDYVWAVHNHLAEDLKTRIRDTFLGLDDTDAVSSKILEGLGAKTFLPAGISDFYTLKEIADSYNLLDPDIK